MPAAEGEPIPAGAGPDEGIGFRYAPKRYALRAPLGLRSSRRPHPVRETESNKQKQLFGNSIAELDALNFDGRFLGRYL